MNLIWHPLALDDLAQIIGYCRHNFGMQTAKRVRTKYRSVFDKNQQRAIQENG